MKRSVLLLFVVFGLTAGWAQAPYQFNFQAVARNLAGNPMTNTAVDFRLSIVQGDPEGTVVYVETQTTQTNNFGLANLLVGSGVADLGSLATLDWMAGPYFLRIELADNDGNYLLVGSSPLMSVPYALHAKTSEQAGPQGIQGEAGANGTNGLDGNGIVATTDNGDGTFTFTYDDGSTFTTSDLTGPQGATGAQGLQGIQGPAGANGTNGLDGNGIASTTDNGDGTFTFTYDDGSTFTTSDLTGPQGAQGPIGLTGPEGPTGNNMTAFAGTIRCQGLGLAILVGSGFSVSHLSTGEYQIVFDTPLSSTPVVVASINMQNGNIGYVLPYNVTSTGFRIRTWFSGSLLDWVGFSFMVYGQ